MDIVSKLISLLVEGPGGYGARGSRGTPGYPVPPEMKPEDRFDIVESGAGRLSADRAAKLADMVEQNAGKLKARGIDVSGAKPLGVGSHGVAFQVGDRVLKMTDDVKEATASAWIKGKKLGNVVEVYDVFRFGKEKVFGIWQELLKPMPANDKNEFVEFVTDLEVESGLLSKLWERPWADVVDNAMEGAKEDEEATPESIQRVRKELMVLQRKYQMDKITSQLAQQKIRFRDFHGGNIMIRGDQHVVIDLGYSQSPKGHIDIMERIMRSLVEAGPPPVPIDAIKDDPHAGGVDEARALEVLKKNAGRLKKKGIDVSGAKALGAGMRGTAFLVGDRVLKVTNDVKEAAASMKIAGKKLRKVVNVYDVWRFPEGKIYGVLQEKLQPLEKKEANTLNFDLWDPDIWGKGTEIPQLIVKAGYDWSKVRDMVIHHTQEHAKTESDPAKQKEILESANKAWKNLVQRFGIGEMVKELTGLGIKFHDYHAGNIMKRGEGDYVVIDLGLSDVAGGREPPVLPETRASDMCGGMGPVDFNPDNREDDVKKFGNFTEEKKADSVAVVSGAYQPFHKGHAKTIRDLAKKFTKVIVIVEKGGKVSFETTWDTIKLSLPDVEPKLEVYRSSGDVVDSLVDIIKNHGSSVEHDTAVNLLVPSTEVDKTKAELKANSDVALDPDVVAVGPLPSSGELTDQQALAAVASGDKEKAKQVFDSHLISNPASFDKVYSKIVDEVGAKKVHEDIGSQAATVKGGSYSLQDVGGENGMTDILNKNAAKLKANKQLNVQGSRALGHGQMGVAYMVGNVVLKLTTDHEEAKTSNYLKGKKLAHVVHIDDVFRLPVTNDEQVPVFAIVQEHLKELEPQEKKDFDALAQYLRDDEVIKTTATGDFSQILAAIKRMIESDTRKELELPALQSGQETSASTTNKRELRAKSLIDKKFADVQQGLIRFMVDKMVGELRSLNIHFADYHSGNVMKRGNVYVINDIGKSKSPGVEPPVLERLTRAVVESLTEAGGYGVATAQDFGGAHTGLRAGSSGWSSPRNCNADDAAMSGSAGTWQERIPDPNLKMKGHSDLPEAVDRLVMSLFVKGKGR